MAETHSCHIVVKPAQFSAEIYSSCPEPRPDPGLACFWHKSGGMSPRVCLLVAALSLVSACSETPVSPTLSTTSTVTVTSTNGSETMTVSGSVYAGSATSDLPLGGAEVAIVTGTTTTSTRTGPKGFYTLTVPPGAATITASKPGYTSKSWSLNVADNLVLNFSLTSD